MSKISDNAVSGRPGMKLGNVQHMGAEHAAKPALIRYQFERLSTQPYVSDVIECAG